MEGIIVTAYLIIYPIYLLVLCIGLINDPELRLFSERTRYRYITDIGEKFLFNWRTLIWFYFLTTFFN